MNSAKRALWFLRQPTLPAYEDFDKNEEDFDMNYSDLVGLIADILKEYDEEEPVHKDFKPGIGPFGEPQIVRTIANVLETRGISARTKRTPDLEVQQDWAIEFKIVRPFGDNGKEAENWTVNLLHPYPGNVSLIGDAIKLVVCQT
jgi:hypothetical protein